MSLRFARYRFDVVFDAPARLPFYAGSMLRGAFGHALRKLACVTRGDNCKVCSLYRSCPYPRIFEPPVPEQHALQKFSQIPAPYVIEPPPPGVLGNQAHARLAFHMVLIGPALNELPLMVAAWQRALRFGLGPANIRGIVEQIALIPHKGEPVPVFTQGGAAIAQHDVSVPASTPVGDTVRLHLHTPLRIQRHGKPLGADQINARDLLVALARRQSLLMDFHGPGEQGCDFRQLAEQADTITLTPERLRWCDWQRYSHRQQQKMALGGIVGSLTLLGSLAPFQTALFQGQWWHLGKNATFGMGHYTMESFA